jgi:hypothetical protein
MSILDTFNADNDASLSELTFTIQFGTEKVHVSVAPDDPERPESLDAALQVYAAALGFDLSRPVTWRRGNQQVGGSSRPEAGETYVASVSHEQKG